MVQECRWECFQRGQRFHSLATSRGARNLGGAEWSATQNAGGTWTSTQLLDTPYLITTFGVDQAGEIYVAHYAAPLGAIYRIVKLAP